MGERFISFPGGQLFMKAAFLAAIPLFLLTTRCAGEVPPASLDVPVLRSSATALPGYVLDAMLRINERKSVLPADGYIPAEIQTGTAAVAFVSHSGTAPAPDRSNAPASTERGLVRPRGLPRRDRAGRAAPPGGRQRSLFDPGSPTVRKKIMLSSGRDSFSFTAALENKGQPYSQAALRSGGEDHQLYYRDGEIIVYSQASKTTAGARLKEWISLSRPRGAGAEEFAWDFEGDTRAQVYLKKEEDGAVGVYSSINIPGLGEGAADRKRSILETVRAAFKGKVEINSDKLLARLEKPVYWTSAGEQRTPEMSIVGDRRLVISITEPASAYPLVIDPTLNWGQWLGGSSGQLVVTCMSSVTTTGELYVGGYGAGEPDEAVVFYGEPGGAQDGFVIEIGTGAAPALHWGQWLGGEGNSYVRALAVNGDEIYAGGDTDSPAGWETVTWQGAHSGGYEGFVIEIQDGATPTLNWGQWLGGEGENYVNAVGVNGDEVYAAGTSDSTASWETVTWQGTHNGGTEGFVIEIQDGATPALNWGQWLGGDGDNSLDLLVVNGNELYVGGASGMAAGWETVGWKGAHSGGRECFVIEIMDGATPSFSWGQWLGGDGYNYVSALAVNGDEVYAGGSSESATAWETMTWRGTFSSGLEGFVIEIQDGAAPTLNWGQWLGGADGAEVYALAVNGDEIYAGGQSSSATSWETVTWQGAHSGGAEGFVIELQDGATPTLNWGQWLGGDAGASVQALAVNGDEIYVGGYTWSPTSWESVTWQGAHSGGYEGFVIELQDGATPTLNWGQWLGGSGYDTVQALAVNGDEIYVGGYTWSPTSWETVTWQGVNGSGSDGFVIEIQDGAAPTLNWGQWLGGDGGAQVTALAVNGDEIYVGGQSDSATSWETVTWQGAHSGGQEGFVIELQDGAAPALNWAQWLGGGGHDFVKALGVNGDKIYAAGESPSLTGWETLPWSGVASDGAEVMVVKILPPCEARYFSPVW